jgi:hypothetical protein
MEEVSPSAMLDVVAELLSDVLTESGVVVRPTVTEMLRGDAGASMVFCQLLWYSNQQEDPAGWFEYSNAQITRATGLQKKAIAGAFRLLARLEMVEAEEQPGAPRRLRVNRAAIGRVLVRMTRFQKRLGGLSGNQAVAHERPVVVAHERPVVVAHERPVSISKNLEEGKTAQISPRPKTVRPPKGLRYHVEAGMLCPEPFPLSNRLLAWARSNLPDIPEETVRVATEKFTRKYRAERKYLPDLAGWEGYWQNYVTSYAERERRDRRGETRRAVGVDPPPYVPRTQEQRMRDYEAGRSGGAPPPTPISIPKDFFLTKNGGD